MTKAGGFGLAITLLSGLLVYAVHRNIDIVSFQGPEPARVFVQESAKGKDGIARRLSDDAPLVETAVPAEAQDLPPLDPSVRVAPEAPSWKVRPGSG